LNEIPFLTKQYEYRVFSERAAEGNLATILCSTDNPTVVSPNLLGQLSNIATDTKTCCYLSQAAENPSIICFSERGEIERCGHGVLAGAAHLDGLGFLYPGAKLNHKTGQYFLRKYEDYYWFSSDLDIEITTANSPLAAELVDTKILETSESMGENGYLIIRLSDNTDLREVKPNLAHLEQNTNQALIITSAHSNHTAIDYQIRYFAPQYGVVEDSATGSANEIAAHFWLLKLKKKAMRCYQASSKGGYIHLSMHNNRLWIGGKVHRVDQI